MNKNNRIYGYELILDLFECDKKIISSRKQLALYVDKLCKLIKMKKYGKTHLPYFGIKKPFTKGYSLLQFIETSSIVGHFSEHLNRAYINIFSCRKFDDKKARNFTKSFFSAKKVKSRFIIR